MDANVENKVENDVNFRKCRQIVPAMLELDFLCFFFFFIMLAFPIWRSRNNSLIRLAYGKIYCLGWFKRQRICSCYRHT